MSLSAPNWITSAGAVAAVKANTAVSISLQALGALKYVLAGGQLPEGVALNTYGSLTGVPTAPGSYEFIISAANGVSASSRSFVLEVQA